MSILLSICTICIIVSLYRFFYKPNTIYVKLFQFTSGILSLFILILNSLPIGKFIGGLGVIVFLMIFIMYFLDLLVMKD